jgi:hypothetical protein
MLTSSLLDCWRGACVVIKVSMTCLALVQNSTNSPSDFNVVLGSHSSIIPMIALSSFISTTRAPVIPISAASSTTDISGFSPLLDILSHLSFSSPGIWVTSLTLISAAMHSNVHTIAAFVTMDPRGRSLIAHVSAVTLSPRSAMLDPDNPRTTCPITASIAPMYSDRFWNDESTPKPSSVKSTAPTPTTTSAPVLRSDQTSPAPLNDASNSITLTGVVWAKDSMVLVNSVVVAGLKVETEDVGRGKGRKVLCEVAVALV